MNRAPAAMRRPQRSEQQHPRRPSRRPRRGRPSLLPPGRLESLCISVTIILILSVCQPVDLSPIPRFKSLTKDSFLENGEETVLEASLPLNVLPQRIFTFHMEEEHKGKLLLSDDRIDKECSWAESMPHILQPHVPCARTTASEECVSSYNITGASHFLGGDFYVCLGRRRLYEKIETMNLEIYRLNIEIEGLTVYTNFTYLVIDVATDSYYITPAWNLHGLNNPLTKAVNYIRGKADVYLHRPFYFPDFIRNARPLTKTIDFNRTGNTITLNSVYAPLPFTFRGSTFGKFHYICKNSKIFHRGHCDRFYYRDRPFCLKPYLYPVPFCPDMYPAAANSTAMGPDFSLDIIHYTDIIHQTVGDWFISLTGSLANKFLDWMFSALNAILTFIHKHLMMLVDDGDTFWKHYHAADDVHMVTEYLVLLIVLSFYVRNLTVISLLMVISVLITGTKRTYMRTSPLQVGHEFISFFSDSHVGEDEELSYWELVQLNKAKYKEK